MIAPTEAAAGFYQDFLHFRWFCGINFCQWWYETSHHTSFNADGTLTLSAAEFIQTARSERLKHQRSAHHYEFTEDGSADGALWPKGVPAHVVTYGDEQ